MKTAFAVSAVLIFAEGLAIDIVHGIQIIEAEDKESAKGRLIYKLQGMYPKYKVHCCLAIEIFATCHSDQPLS